MEPPNFRGICSRQLTRAPTSFVDCCTMAVCCLLVACCLLLLLFAVVRCLLSVVWVLVSFSLYMVLLHSLRYLLTPFTSFLFLLTTRVFHFISVHSISIHPIHLSFDTVLSRLVWPLSPYVPSVPSVRTSACLFAKQCTVLIILVVFLIFAHLYAYPTFQSATLMVLTRSSCPYPFRLLLPTHQFRVKHVGDLDPLCAGVDLGMGRHHPQCYNEKSLGS